MRSSEDTVHKIEEHRTQLLAANTIEQVKWHQSAIKNLTWVLQSKKDNDPLTN